MNLIVIGNEWKENWKFGDVYGMGQTIRMERNRLEIFNRKRDKKELEFLSITKKRCDWLIRKLILLKKLHNLHDNDLFRTLVKYDYVGSVQAMVGLQNYTGLLVNNLFHYAVEFESVNVLRELMNTPFANPEWQNNRALCEAISMGNLEMAKILLKNPNVANIPCNNGSFERAIQNGHLPMVKFLIEAGKMNPNYSSAQIFDNPLMLAIANKRHTIVKFLLTLEITTPILFEIFHTIKNEKAYPYYIGLVTSHKNFVSDFKLMEPFIKSKDLPMVQALAKRLCKCDAEKVFHAIARSENWEMMKNFIVTVNHVTTQMVAIVTRNFNDNVDIHTLPFLLEKCFDKQVSKNLNLGTLFFTYACRISDKNLIKLFLHNENSLLQMDQVYSVLCELKNQELISLILKHKVKFVDSHLLVEQAIQVNGIEYAEFLCNTTEIQQALNPNLLSDTALIKLAETKQFKLLELFISDACFVATNKTNFLKRICHAKNLVALELVLKYEKTGLKNLVGLLLEYACELNVEEIVPFLSQYSNH